MRSAYLSLPAVLLAALCAPAADPPARPDTEADPLPAGALARIGSTRFRNPNSTIAIALSPDGKALAVSDTQGVRLLDLATGKELRALKTPAGPGPNQSNQLTFSADGKVLAGANYMGHVQLWDPATGETAGEVAPPPPEKGGGRSANALTLSGDGKFVAFVFDTFGPAPKTEAFVYECATGKQTARVETIHNNGVRAFLSGDGKLLATTGQHFPRGGAPEPPERRAEINATVQVWDAVTGKELHQLHADPGAALANVAFSPDGKQLTTGTTTGGLIVWDAAGKELRRLAGRRNLGAFVGYSPDGKTLAAASFEGAVQTWDPATGQRLGLYELPRTNMMRYAFTKGGRLLAYGSTGDAVMVWDVRAEKSLTPADGHLAAITAVGFTPDGKGVVGASWDGLVTFHDPDGKETRRVQLRADGMVISGPGTYRMGTPRLSPDCKYALASPGSGLSLFELGKGREVCTFTTGFSPFGTGACFSADGGRVATAAQDPRTRAQVLRLFDVGSGQELRKFDGLAVQPQGSALAAAAKVVVAASFISQPTGQVGELRAWDAATGKSLWRTEGARVGFQPSLAFSPDGRLVAAVDPTGTVTLYDAADGRESRRLTPPPGTSNVSAPVFSPDGRLLAVGAYEISTRKARVRVYEVASASLRHEFTGHEGIVTAVAFSPDGKRLASGGHDTTILLWDLTGRNDGEVAKGKPTADELDKLWVALGDPDGRAGLKAVRRLEGAPDEAVALLAKHVKPEEGKGDDTARLIAALDDDSFDIRQAAHKRLAAMGKGAEAALNKALAGKPSAEAKRAIEDLLEKLKDKGAAEAPPPDLVRGMRAVEVLEVIGTPEARKVLEALAKGGADAPLAAAAREALARLGRAGKP
jgi:WD40 repeat protein